MQCIWRVTPPGRERRTPRWREGLGQRHINKTNKFNGQGQWTTEDSKAAETFITSARVLQHIVGQPPRHKANGTKKRSRTTETKDTDGAAGAERKHQHRDNPTRRREKREAGRQHKTRGERAHKNQRGCSSALTDGQWGSWIITDEYLSEEMQGTPATHTQWQRGYTIPHRATAFGATVSTKSRNKALTTRQAERKAAKPRLEAYVNTVEQSVIQRQFSLVSRPEYCENTRAAWQLFFTARTWAKPHRFDSSVTLLLRRVVQSKTQWHSNVLKLLKLLQKSSQASKTFFQLLQIKRSQLKLTNNLQNSYQISSQHQVPKTWVKQHPKTPKTQKQTKIHLQALPCTNWFHLVPNWFLPGSYRFLWVL